MYVHQGYWPVIFLLLCPFLGIRVKLASLNVFGSVPSFSIFWKSLKRIGINTFKCLVEFTYEAIWSWILFVGSFLIPDLILLQVTGLFRFSVFSRFSLERLYVPRNLSISSMLPNLLEFKFS